MLKAQGLESRGLVAGDVLYIYTGWGDNWKDPDTEKFYYTKGPGLSYDAAKYIEQKAVVLVALDNPFTDPVAEGFLQGQGAAARGHAGGPAVRDPSPQPDAGRASTTSRTPTSARMATRQGLAVLHHHPAVAHARRLGIAGAAGRHRGGGAAVKCRLKLRALAGIAPAGSRNQGNTWQVIRS